MCSDPAIGMRQTAANEVAKRINVCQDNGRRGFALSSGPCPLALRYCGRCRRERRYGSSAIVCSPVTKHVAAASCTSRRPAQGCCYVEP